MTKSLVERLNEMSNRFGSGRSSDPMAAAASDLMEEAMNEIERLTAERDVARAEVERHRNDF